MESKQYQDFIPYSIVWNMEEREPCLIVNIDDCDEKTINEYYSSGNGKIPIRFFSSNKKR